MDTAVIQVQGVGCRKQDDTEIQVSWVCGCAVQTAQILLFIFLLIFVTFSLFFIEPPPVPFDLQESNRVYQSYAFQILVDFMFLFLIFYHDGQTTLRILEISSEQQ